MGLDALRGADPGATLERWVPGLRMLRTYQFVWLPSDLAAGITLGAVMVPVGLAYGKLAGVPLAVTGTVRQGLALVCVRFCCIA